MNAVGLRYKNEIVNLPQDITIEWTGEEDLLEPNYLGQAFSASFSIPKKGNEHIFNFFSNPSSVTNKSEYDGFCITIDGNDWWPVTLIINQTSDDLHFYEVQMSSVSSSMYAAKETSIREILAEVEWSYPAGGYPTVYSYFNGSSDRGVRFPHCHFYNEMEVFLTERQYLHNTDVYAVPFFSLYHLLFVLADYYGYQVELNIRDIKKFKKIIIGTATRFTIILGGDSLPYGVFLPDLSLNDFFKEVQFYSGGCITIDSIGNKIKVESIDFNKSIRPLNWKDRLTNFQVVPVENKNILLQMGWDSDFLLSENTDLLEGRNRGEFDSLSNIIAISDAEVGDYAFAKFSNRFYKAISKNDTIDWQIYSHPFLDKKTGTDDLIIFNSQLSPARRERFASIEFSVKASLIQSDNTSLYAMLSDFEDTTILSDFDTYGIISVDTQDAQAPSVISMYRTRKQVGSSSRTYRSNDLGIRTLTLVNASRSRGGGVASASYDFGTKSVTMFSSVYKHYAAEGEDNSENKIELSTPYINDLSISKIKCDKYFGYFFPVVGKPLTRLDNYEHTIGDNNQDTSGIVLNWHGMHYNFDKSGTYPYASSDNYYYNEVDGVSTLDSTSLNLITKDNNLWTDKYKAIYDFLRKTKILKAKCTLTPFQLKSLFSKHKNARHSEGVMRIKSFRATLTQNGIRDQEIEGYSL